MQALSVEGCTMVSDTGVRALLQSSRSGTSLRALNVSRCPRITTAAFQLHTKVPPCQSHVRPS